MYPARTITEGHSLVNPSDDFKNEVANTSEKMAKPRYIQLDTLSQTNRIINTSKVMSLYHGHPILIPKSLNQLP